MFLSNVNEVTIKNKEVKKIVIKNGVVFEKTSLTLTSSATSTIFLNSFTLTATLKDSNGDLLNGTIEFYQNNTLIKTLTTTNGVASFSHSNSTPANYTYTAKFVGTDVYKQSSSNSVSVNITKDTPTIASLTGNIYYNWKIGAILKNSKGTALSGKAIVLSGGKTGTLTTNSAGKVTVAFTGTQGNSYTVTYKFNGDAQYNACSVSKTFTLNKDITTSKCVGTMEATSTSGARKAWSDYYTNCSDNYARCVDIATSSGTKNTPAKLKGSVTFSIPSGATLIKNHIWWKSKIAKKSNNGWGSISKPTVSVTGTGSDSKEVTTAAPGKDSYVTGSFDFSATVGGLNNGMNVYVDFPKNTASNVVDYLYLIGPQVQITYRPAQGTL